MPSFSERRTALMFAATQALFQTASVVMVTVGGLIGLQLASDPRLATLPVGMTMVAATIAMIPAALFMQRFGRRKGFLLGCLLGSLAGVVATLAVLLHSFMLLLLANALLGIYGAFSGYYRFAAADAVSTHFRSQALSWVVAGGVVAAFAGPAIVRHADSLAGIALPVFVVPFVAMTILGLVAMALVSQLHIAEVTTASAQVTRDARELIQIIKQPVFITALASSTVGYAVMVMIMTVTPIAMNLCGLSLGLSTNVIQWHILGMFVPSFFTGKIIQRVGVLPVMSTGVILLIAQVIVAVSGITYGHFTISLLLLGLGWNFLYIGGSTLLTESYRPGEQARTQAAHDFTVLGITSIASLSAGGLLTTLGWRAVNFATLPALVLIGLAIASLAWRRHSMQLATQ